MTGTRHLLTAWAVTLFLAVSAAGADEMVFPGKEWQTRSPEEAGLDAGKLDLFATRVGGSGVVIRDGYLVKSWGDPAKRGDWASASKPVMSTLLFFAVSEGTLKSVDDPVRPWVQKHWPGRDLVEKDRIMTFRHLADMTSGYNRGEAPGTHWAYNDYAIKLYGTLLTEVFGTSLDDAVKKRLSALEFQDGGVFRSRGGLGVDASARDFARIGWFWMHRGKWKNQQLLPKEFFDRYLVPDVPPTLPRSTRPGEDTLGIGTHGGHTDQSALGPGVYGFNWWFNTKIGTSEKLLMPGLPPDAFQANGHWGSEVMLIVPSLRMVVAARGNWRGMELKHAVLLMEAVPKEPVK